MSRITHPTLSSVKTTDVNLAASMHKQSVVNTPTVASSRAIQSERRRPLEA